MTPLIDNPFSLVYFPTALALGALHALEPGHAKTLTAVYLIGIEGTKRDAICTIDSPLSKVLGAKIELLSGSFIATPLGKC